ncbi:hypothetical protein KKA08_08350, partial [bacterium]|nr:hypothetical protein [bacterium]
IRHTQVIAWLPLIIALAVSAASFNVANQVDRYLFQMLRPHIELTRVLETPYGIIETTEYEGQTQIHENGLTVSVSDDLPDAEERSHLFLAQHPSPEQVLWVGGALGGGIEQALLHPSLKKIDVIELNPLLLDSQFLSDPIMDDRAHFLIGDGRTIIRQSPPETYDLIVLQLPGPRTIRLSKYYTVEFFREVDRALKPAGVFGFAIESSGEYIAAETASLLATLSATLQEVFPQVQLLPGPNVIFLAANSDGQFASSQEQISGILMERSIEPLYWDSYRLRNRLSPSRFQVLHDAIANAATRAVNTDAAPSSFFLQQVVWSRQVRAGLADLLIWLKKILIPASLIFLVTASIGTAAIIFWRKRSRALAANWTVMTAGFSAISLEILCLVGYQVHFGSGYREVGVLLGLYMAGLALGGIAALKCKPDSSSLARFVQMTLIAFPLIFFALFSSMPGVIEKSPTLGRGLYHLFMLCIGGSGGMQFLFMARLKSGEEVQASGFLYALDLLGAALGASLIGLLTIPILGVWITVLGLVWLNVMPLLLLLSLPSIAVESSA